MLRELLIVLILSFGVSARRQLVGNLNGNPGAIAAAVMAANRNKQTSHEYGSVSNGPPGPDPAELARLQEENAQRAIESNNIYKEKGCSHNPCEVGTKVEFMRTISKGNGQQVQEGETGTVMEHRRSGSRDMYTVESDCQTLTLQVAAYMLQRSSSKKCPASRVAGNSKSGEQQMPQKTPGVFNVGDPVVTTERKTGFNKGEEGVVRKFLPDKGAYRVCLGGQVQKTVMGLMTGGTKCSEGREVQIAAQFLRHK